MTGLHYLKNCLIAPIASAWKSLRIPAVIFMINFAVSVTHICCDRLISKLGKERPQEDSTLPLFFRWPFLKVRMTDFMSCRVQVTRE